MKGDRPVLFYDLMKDVVPDDTSGQTGPFKACDAVFSKKNVSSVLDLGCGTGSSVDYFRVKRPDTRWIGVDIAFSPEVALRKRTDAEFITFDGVNLPFPDASFDMVFSNQVFEHVRYPESLLREVFRVLKPGGTFIGSVSHLEPYHSMSLWNYTPYGLRVILETAGLRVTEIRPGIDAIAIIVRRIFERRPVFRLFWKYESPLNMLISALSWVLRKRPRTTNMIKLIFCAQFVFVAEKKTA